MSGGHNRFPLAVHGSADFHPPLPPAVPSFNPKLFLVPYLDNLIGSEALATARKASPEAGLQELIWSLPEKSVQILEAKLGKPALDELVALSKEGDAELFWEDAFRLAHRLESQDHLEASLSLLQSISGGLGGNYFELRREVDRSQKVLLGQGEFGDRFEFMLRRVTRELSDPWAITAFGTGSLAFRAAKLGALSRLLGGSVREYLSSRVVAEGIATGVGIAAEAPAFLLTSKLGRQIGGQRQDWRGETLAQELAGVGITLFCMRSFGAAGERLVKGQYLGNSLNSVLPQGMMFSGILTAQRAEELLNLRPATNGPTFLADGLATFLQFRVGGRLAEDALGKGFQRVQRSLDLQAANFSSSGWNWGFARPALAAAGSAPSPEGRPSIFDLIQKPLMSENHGDGGGEKPPEVPRTGPRLHLVKGDGQVPEAKGPTGEASQDPRFGAGPGPKRETIELGDQQILDISLARMLRSSPMDEKDRHFRTGVDAVVLGSASETRRKTLEQKVIAKLPAPRREELNQNLKNLHPELVDIFGSVASEMPWQSLAQVFAEMKLIRTSPGEIAEPPPSGSASRPWREALSDELRSDHRRLFDAPLSGTSEPLNLAVIGLSEPSANLLGHWTQNPGTRLLTAHLLGLPGLPAEAAILEAYQRWSSRSPESE